MRLYWTFLFLILLSTAGMPAALALDAPVQVTFGGGLQPAVSPDGQWLLYRIYGVGICRMSTEGGQPDTLNITGYEFDWSPTGESFLYTNNGLHIYDFEGGTSYELHSGVGWDDGPVWSPLGTEIAVQGEPVMLISFPDGQLSTVNCEDPDGTDCAGEFPTWSPDGQWIAFEDGLEILKVSRDGGPAQVVVEKLGDVADPAWSPDGKWIAFVLAGQYPIYNIWVTDARGPEYGLLQVTADDESDWSPAWSADSATIYFSSDRNGLRDVWKVPFNAQLPTKTKSLGGMRAMYR